MPVGLDAEFVKRYARPPAEATVATAVSLHENVRTVLGDGDFLTFLQGSYKNQTALAEMNDVDVVAVSRAVRPDRSYHAQPVDWQGLFGAIERNLEASAAHRGKWTRRDKCIQLKMGINIDVVPAVMVDDPVRDPIEIYSFRTRATRRNWPRQHSENDSRKSGATNGAFKETVRLFKRWAKAQFGDAKVAPSYYIESLIYSMPDRLFTGQLATDFVNIADEISRRFTRGYETLPRIAGEGQLIGEPEWARGSVVEFRNRLTHALPYARGALAESTPDAARACWMRAFNGQAP